MPASVKWDLWLGPARCGPMPPAIIPLPGSWWDLYPALGDMACHTVNMPFMALGLRDATAVQARSGGHNGDSYQKWSTIDFEFPATEARGPVKFHWYDGGKLPSPDLLGFQEAAETVPLKDLDDEHQRDAFAAGCLVIGDKGRLYAPGITPKWASPCWTAAPSRKSTFPSPPAISRNGSAPSAAASRRCPIFPTTPAP